MKNTLPGIFEKAFSNILDPDIAVKPQGLGEDFFFKLAQNTRDIIFHAQLVPDLRFDYISPSCFEITGYTQEEFYADPLLVKKCWHPDDLKNLEAQYFSYQKSMIPQEIRWIRKDGAVIWIEHLITFETDKDDKPVACQIIAHDITARKKTEEAFQETQIFTNNLLVHAPHATVVINADTSIRYVNPTWEKLNGWTLSEVIGAKAPYPWWPEDQREAWLAPFMKSFEQKSGRGALPAYKKSGEMYWIDITWAAVYKDDKLDYLLINSLDITERKKVEAALATSEEKFSKAFSSSPTAICLINREDQLFHEINDSFTRFTGYSREEVIGHTTAGLNLWVYPQEQEEMTITLNSTGSLANMRIHSRSKNGDIRVGLFSGQSLEIGGARYLILSITDITEQVKATEALRESEEKFARVYNFSPNAICLMNADDHKFFDANESFYRFTGYTKEEIYGHNQVDLHLCEKPEDQAFIAKCLAEQGYIYNHKVTCRTKNGELRGGLFSADTIEIGGKKCYLIGITDIDEGVKATEALLESEEKFARAFKGSPEIISISTLTDGRFIDVNESYCHATGYTREEVIGKSVMDINIWVYESESHERFRILKEQGRVSNKEYEFRTKSGEIRTWLYSAELITISGEPCLMSASIDITERKAMEQALANEAIRRRILIEQSSEGIVIIDETGKVYDVNWRFAEMLGYSMEEASRLYIWDWEKGYTPENLREQLKNVGSSGDHFTSHHLRKDGQYIDVDVSTNGATYAGQKLIFCVCHDISERNRMEKALRESEEKFALAFNASPHMFSISDMVDGKYVEVNDSFLAHTGYTREELIGKTQGEVNLWAYPEECDRMVKHMQENGKLRNEEYQFRNKSGEIRTWLCSADIVSIGGRQSLLAIAADITERKQAEALLRDSEERFSRAFNASPISMSITRLSDGKYLEVNESYLRDKGYSREEIIGKTSTEVPVWVSVEESHKLADELKAQGRVHNKKMQYRTKSGEIRIGLVSAELINLGNDQCMLILNNDITQQKQAEEQLRLLGSVTQQVSDSTIIVGPDFKITYMNQAALDMFGYPFDEVKGRDLAFFNAGGLDETEVNRIQNVLLEGKMVNSIVTKKRKDGTVITCDCRLSPMFDDKDNVVSYIDVMRDITKQKDVETKLQEHKKLIDSILATMPEGVLVIDSHDRILLANKALYNILHINGRFTRNKPLSEILPLDQYFTLQRAITSGEKENNTVEFRYNVQGAEKIIYCVIVKMDGERTLMTFSDVSREREEEEKLYLTDRLASIGEMAAGLAHELNNPLTGILTLSQIMVNSGMSKENKEDIECIYSEAKRAAGIVKNVLLFARNKPDDSGQASANDVITDVLRLREYEERSNNIKVVTELEENLPDITIDKGQLQQVILNILSNAEAAIKEADRPGIITVTTQRVNDHVNLHFSDNGCGIKKQNLPRIFDPFFTTKEVGKGTGLGLSICYSIIVKHGGKISVKSQVDEGTTFTIRMPVAE